MDELSRVVEQRGAVGRPSRIRVELTDVSGRHVIAVGTCTSAEALSAFTGHLTWATLVQWETEGTAMWGEDHDFWTQDYWRERRPT